MSYEENRFLYEPLAFTPKKPVHLRDQPFRNLKHPMASIRLGMKRSGKGVSMDKEIAVYYNAYFTCIWLHAAGGFENLYTIVNKNCRDKYTTIKAILKLCANSQNNTISKKLIEESIPKTPRQIELILSLMKDIGFIFDNGSTITIKTEGYAMLNNNFLNCDCHGTLDTLWLHPDYLIPNKQSLDWFNGLIFKTYAEYNHAYVNCQQGVNEYLPEQYFLDKNYKKHPIYKPKSMTDRIKPILVTRPFTPPINKSKLDIFKDQIREAVLFGRSDHRIITNTPASFPETHQGRVEKYSTAAEFLNYLPELVQSDFQRLQLDKPRDQWTPKEKAHWKIALFLGEVRELAPNSKLSPHQESAISKRALYAFMPKSRHSQCWVFMDLQSAGDMFEGVKQQNDIFMIKRSSQNILGDHFGWFYKLIENQRRHYIESRGFTEKNMPYGMIERLNSFLPSVDEIPDNKTYVIYPNDEFRLIKIDMQKWHHKTESDNLQTDTGITWTIRKDQEDETEADQQQKPRKPISITSKKISDEDWIYIKRLRTEKTSWTDIIKQMRESDKQKGIEVDRYASRDPESNLSNKFKKWEKKQLELEIK